MHFVGFLMQLLTYCLTSCAFFYIVSSNHNVTVCLKYVSKFLTRYLVNLVSFAYKAHPNETFGRIPLVVQLDKDRSVESDFHANP